MVLVTPLGFLRLRTSPLGVLALELSLVPEASPPSPLAQRVWDRVQAYFAGERPDFLDIPLDYASLSPARIRLYQAVRHIPYGQTVSYGDLGRALGLSPRAVGAGLRACPFFLLVPAHRVVHRDGRLGGFAGWEGVKAWLLRFEGAL